MSRYIDADKLAEHKFSYITNERYVSDGRKKSEEEVYAYKVGYNSAIEYIEQFEPTVDAVEVVRCKDCKHFTYHKWKECNWCRKLHIPWINENGFCSNGERRDDVEEID